VSFVPDLAVEGKAHGREAGAVVVVQRTGYRVGQFGRALAPWVPERDLALAAAILSPVQLAAFQRLPAADQRHAARVARTLLAADARDPDLIVAALLHDLGKVEATGSGRVWLPHRVANVLLSRRWPAIWRRLSDQPHAGPALGCYLLRHHAVLGAAWAARLGVAPRACQLIAAHQEGVVAPDLLPALAQLRQADDRS
jgi:hypothetical protein